MGTGKQRTGYDRGKRVFDVLIAAGALVVLSPVIVAVAILVRLRLGSPILFHQLRPGRDGELFKLYKFRTMLDLQDADGLPRPDADRLTPFGRRLRATSLDELPSLWNVLRGHMSLVGPRPLLPEYLPLYSAEQARRHEVRPGITGLAQVNGRNAIEWDDKFRLDVQYVDRRCWSLDLRILWQTLGKVVRSDGISRDGHATAPKFVGRTDEE